MAVSVIVDASFLITLLNRRESNHRWAADQAQHFPPPWRTCEAAISETFHLLGPSSAPPLVELIRERALIAAFHLADNTERLLSLMHKYEDVPMSFADACLVRMTEILPDPILLTTDRDFRIYRRHSRQIIPCMMPG
ncbi:MAG TPA: PIN domain-containing protein [Xanthobacteraceae bacterium]|jgi:predicted nucleic acid-binding protein